MRSCLDSGPIGNHLPPPPFEACIHVCKQLRVQYQVEHAELAQASERGWHVLEEVLAQVQEREAAERADRVRHARQPVAAQIQVLEPARTAVEHSSSAIVPPTPAGFFFIFWFCRLEVEIEAHEPQLGFVEAEEEGRVKTKELKTVT